MKSITAFITPILSVVGVGALGIGGYNAITTGCPLGMCWHKASSSQITTVANPATPDSASPLTCCAGGNSRADAVVLAASVQGMDCDEPCKTACGVAEDAACPAMAPSVALTAAPACEADGTVDVALEKDVAATDPAATPAATPSPTDDGQN